MLCNVLMRVKIMNNGKKTNKQLLLPITNFCKAGQMVWWSKVQLPSLRMNKLLRVSAFQASPAKRFIGMVSVYTRGMEKVKSCWVA
jgi:hypothetical protein